MYWYIMRFDHSKHDVEQFAYDVEVLGKRLRFRSANNTAL